MIYKDWLSKWLLIYVKPNVKIRTYSKYEQIARVHILPILGEYNLADLRTDILQGFVAQLVERRSANTVNNAITVLRQSLKMATIMGECDKQFADKIIRPKVREKRVECFSLNEQKQIEKYVADSKKTKLFGIVLCLYTGIRIGELLALMWSDIDFQKGLLSINKSCHYGKNGVGIYGRIIDEPKTEQSNRIIPLPKAIVAHLSKMKKCSASQFIINDNGKAVPTRSYQRSFELLLRKLNIPHRCFHALRHTFATRALECGMDVKTLSELLGHKNPTITLNRYAHSLMDHKIEMINKLGKFCGLR